MTNEEIIKGLQAINEHIGKHFNEGGAWMAEFIDNAIKALEQTRWIPCSERLPEFGQDILLSLRSLDIKTGFRAETEPYFYCHGVDGCYIEPQNVLAWTPLPQPYKAESEDKE